MQSFEISGAGGHSIRGNIHAPASGAESVLLVCHGFKGYKDYGFFPYLTETLAPGRAVIRFNFSHSGIGDDHATFQHPELFEHDTFGKQIEDLQRVIAMVSERFVGARIALLGHSRGGVTSLLLGGWDQGISAIITLSAPCRANRFPQEITEQLRRDGFISSPSARTGQSLRISRDFLDEIDKVGERRNVEDAVRRLQQPLCVIHGSADPTVPAADASAIASWYPGEAEVHLIEGANHVFDCTNPMTEPSDAIERVIQISSRFLIKQDL